MVGPVKNAGGTNASGASALTGDAANIQNQAKRKASMRPHPTRSFFVAGIKIIAVGKSTVIHSAPSSREMNLMSKCVPASVLIFIVLALTDAPCVHAVTQSEIARQISEIEQNSPDPVRRQQLTDAYQRASEFASAQAAHQAELEDLRRTATRAPGVRRELLEKETQRERAKQIPPVSQRELTLAPAALEQLVEATRTERTTLEGKLSSYELRLRELGLRPAENARLKTVASARIAELETRADNVRGTSADELSRAQTTTDQAELGALQAEIETLNQEQLVQGLRVETLNLRREVVLLEIERLSARTTALEQALIERRQDQTEVAQEIAKKAQLATSNAHPLARQLALDNQALVDELAQVNDGQARAAARRAEYAERRARINSEYEIARQRLQIAGASASLGRILVDQRRRLPQLSVLQRQSKADVGAVSRASLRRIEIDEQLASLASRQPKIATSVAGVAPSTASSVEFEQQIAALLRAQKSVLENLDTNYASLLRVLDVADAELTQLTITVSTYSELLDERLLWIPNASPLSFSLLGDASNALRQIANPTVWRAVLNDGWRGAIISWFQTGLSVLAVIVLLQFRRRFDERLAAIASRQKGEYSERVRDTAEVAGLTTGVAAPIAIIWWSLGAILRASPDATEWSFALGQMLPYVAALMFLARWVQASVSAHGLAVSQIGVKPDTALKFGPVWVKHMRLFVPTYGVAVGLDTYAGELGQHSVTRLLFMLAMMSLAAFGYWVIQSRGHATRELARSMTQRWVPLALLVFPATALLALSIFGYHYTAIQLSEYYLITIGCVVGTAALYLIVLRWLRIAAARLELKYAAELITASISATDVARELATFNAQARLILRNLLGWSLAVGLYWVWRDVLPALTIFDRISLWNIEIKDAAGVIHPQPITIANIALSVIIIVIMSLAARNVPGVVEVGLLQRFRVHHGSRYAITSLLRYAIVAIGLSLALSTLGLRWSQIQWLVAALGVGLGFGLQEIFANFISGLILLFERPIRVGDVVTIGEMTGKVRRIQIRATTIRDADNKEIVVPNKTFITERFLNWTLSDQVTRIVINIGVAYGTDVDKVMRLLLDAAFAHPKVMREPAPEVVLAGFGDSALLFELQVFAEELSHRSDVRHELNTAIYRVFAEHSIEIPFPQRDLHLRNAIQSAALPGVNAAGLTHPKS